MPKRSSKKQKSDFTQIALDIVQQATGQKPKRLPPAHIKKNPAAVALGRLGGQKGGPARAKALSSKERTEIAKKAAKTRWKKKRIANA